MDFQEQLAMARDIIWETFFNMDVADEIEDLQLSFNARFTSCMGDARYCKESKKAIIRLSTPLWPLATSAQRRETIIHEAAHVIDWVKHGRSSHGWKWRRIMIQLGYPNPARCHDVDTSSVKRGKRKQKQCKCACGIKPIGPIRHKRAMAGLMTYKCTVCKQIVTPI